MDKQALIITCIAAIPLTLIGVSSIRYTSAQLSDPCTQWGAGQSSRPASADGRRSGTLADALQGPRHSLLNPVQNGQDCAGHISGVAETKQQAIVRMIMISGGLVLASLLGVIGAAISWPVLIAAAGVTLIAESVFTGLWPVILLAGILMIVSAYRIRKQKAGLAQPT